MSDNNVVVLKQAQIRKRFNEQLRGLFHMLTEYEKTKISNEEYALAVQSLIDYILCHPTTDSAKVCASVLLSCYCGAEFHVNISSLSILDYELYQAVLIVIRGRVERGKEPHQMIESGGEVFTLLWKRYQHITVANSAKQQCQCCDGAGKLYKSDDDYEQGFGENCLECQGRGWRWPEE